MTAPPFPFEVTPYALPFARPFRGLTQRQGVVLQGRNGWGEFAPFADYNELADARWLVAALEAATDPDTGDGREVASNAILAELPDADLSAGIQHAMTATGCTTVKVKIGGRPTGAEIKRIAQLYRAGTEVAPDLRLRLDGNGRFDLPQAQELLAALQWSDVAVDYVEQPCRTVAELRSLKQQFPSIRLAADEALRRDREFDRVSQFADVAIVKIAPLGGLAAVRRLIADLDVEVVVSGAAESSVGLSRDVVAAAEFGAPDAVHGLGTGTLLAEDLVADPVVPRGGVVPARRVPTDAGALARATDRVAPSDRRDWHDRVARAWSVSLAQGLISDEVLVALGVTG